MSRTLVFGMLLVVAQGASNTTQSQFLRPNTSPPQVDPTRPSVSADMTSSAMEAAITDLMLGKTQFGATPMGGSVKTIENLLTKTMMPKVISAHNDDQKNLRRMAKELEKCGKVKNRGLNMAKPSFAKYVTNSRLHKKCRGVEAVRYSSKVSCLQQQKSLANEKKLRCTIFGQVSKKYGTQKDNVQIVKKSGGEKVEPYLRRIAATFCGSHVHGSKGQKSKKGGWGGGLPNSNLDKYLKAKTKCVKATAAHTKKVKECKIKVRNYKAQKSKCNQYQEVMDSKACRSAVLTKDACQAYAGCYFEKKKAYEKFASTTVWMERDRKAEWRGLKRMECLIKAFADGKVSNKEVDVCKKQSHSTKRLDIKYPKLPPLVKCARSTLYPSTGAWKRREVAPLPNLAKGKVAQECSGVNEMPTTPRRGSPKGCKGEQVSLVGHYSAGGLVKITNGLDVYRSNQKNSCPRGTKLFSPASRNDWRTFLNSAKPLRAPHWIIDVTRNGNGHSGSSAPMNSKTAQGKSWRTQDGSPWWLRSSKYGEPNGDYKANCYMNIKNVPNENSVTMNDHNCNYHSRSYYCQPWKGNVKPKAGSPRSCRCTQVDLTGRYSPGGLVKCEQCLDVRRITQKNSCPNGMKIFSPRSRADWKTVFDSTPIPAAPHRIIDITRPQNGCGGCTKFPMKSSSPSQASWRTSDGSAWWLRNSRYSEPNGDYHANCYLNLRGKKGPDNVGFNDWNCNIHSKSYLCQPIKQRRKTPPKPKHQARVIVTKMHFLVQGVNACPKGSEAIASQADCKRISSKQGWEFGGAGNWKSLPKGCWRWTTNNPNYGKVYYNSNKGRASTSGAIMCKKVGRSGWKATIPKGGLSKSSQACDTFTKFRKNLGLVGNIQISAGGTTRTCNTASVANQIITAFKNGQRKTFQCDGQKWNVGSCGGPQEINVGCPGICGCSANCVTVRPCIGNNNWGGYSKTCGQKTEQLGVSTAKSNWVISKSRSCKSVCQAQGMKCDRGQLKKATMQTDKCSTLRTVFGNKRCIPCSPAGATNAYCFPGTVAGNIYYHTSWSSRSFSCNTVPDSRVTSACPCS